MTWSGKITSPLVGLFMLMLMLEEAASQGSAGLAEYTQTQGRYLPRPLPPYSVQVVNNSTLTKCAAQCNLYYQMQQFPCFAFEFVLSNGICLMTNVTTIMVPGGYRGLWSSVAISYFERSKYQYSHLFLPIPHKTLSDVSMYFVGYMDVPLEACALACLRHSGKPCLSFAYSPNKRICSLSDTFYTEMTINGPNLTVSADFNQYQYYTPWPCNTTIPWQYTPRAIASQDYPYAVAHDVSCYIRLEAPKNHRVRVNITDVYVAADFCSDLSLGLTFHDGATRMSRNLNRFCKPTVSKEYIIQSTGNYMYIEMSLKKDAMAFKALYDHDVFDACLDHQCRHNSTCVRGETSYTCACSRGYTGHMCELEINECVSNPCHASAKCIDRVGGFYCACPRGRGGPTCDLEIGACSDNPCVNGRCIPMGTTGFLCNCDADYTGRRCEKYNWCKMEPCQHGKCVNHVIGHTCECEAGYTGESCNRIDFCRDKPCAHGHCVEVEKGFYCNCSAGFEGTLCNKPVNNCVNVSCGHGECISVGLSYFCRCSPGYSGDNCSKLVDYCSPSPCVHGECFNANDGLMHNGTFPWFICECEPGYAGKTCDKEIDFCEPDPCNHGTCTNNHLGYLCICEPGFTDTNCSTGIDFCAPNPCQNGTCSNGRWGFECFCEPGFTGHHCNVSQDPCGFRPCVHGECLSHALGYPGAFMHECRCEPGYTGQACNVTLDACSYSPCVHGSCIPDGFRYRCYCDAGFAGVNCNLKTDPCLSNPCTFGTCRAQEDRYVCVLHPMVETLNQTALNATNTT